MGLIEDRQLTGCSFGFYAGFYFYWYALNLLILCIILWFHFFRTSMSFLKAFALRELLIKWQRHITTMLLICIRCLPTSTYFNVSPNPCQNPMHKRYFSIKSNSLKSSLQYRILDGSYRSVTMKYRQFNSQHFLCFFFFANIPKDIFHKRYTFHKWNFL